jgi:hypothetical protein
MNIPWKTAWSWSAFNLTSVRHTYFAPGQVLRVLAGVQPLLDEPRAARLTEYLRAERRDYPPETTPHLPSDEGARREPWKLTSDFIARDTNVQRPQNFHIRTGTVPAEALYDLAEYYRLLGPDLLRQERFDLDRAAARTIQPWLDREDWATWGWLSWQIHEVNRQIAAAIGLVRLARMSGNTQWEERGLIALSRYVVHRFALAKYPRWRFDTETLGAGPAYHASWDAGGVTLSERIVALGFGQNQEGLLPYFSDTEGPLACIVPELGRFMSDHLKAECLNISQQEAASYPDGLAAWGTARRTAEWWHSYPEDSRRIFLNHAWIIGRDADWLYRRTDVPWCRVGDLYHIETRSWRRC